MSTISTKISITFHERFLSYETLVALYIFNNLMTCILETRTMLIWQVYCIACFYQSHLKFYPKHFFACWIIISALFVSFFRDDYYSRHILQRSGKNNLHFYNIMWYNYINTYIEIRKGVYVCIEYIYSIINYIFLNK